MCLSLCIHSYLTDRCILVLLGSLTRWPDEMSESDGGCVPGVSQFILPRKQAHPRCSVHVEWVSIGTSFLFCVPLISGWCWSGYAACCLSVLQPVPHSVSLLKLRRKQPCWQLQSLFLSGSFDYLADVPCSMCGAAEYHDLEHQWYLSHIFAASAAFFSDIFKRVVRLHIDWLAVSLSIKLIYPKHYGKALFFNQGYIPFPSVLSPLLPYATGLPFCVSAAPSLVSLASHCSVSSSFGF